MIPVFNPPADYLAQALRSVLAQDPGPELMQIEVVDDCSPKVDVAALVKAVACERVKVSQTPRNLGLAGCWNTCIERACGQWVHILHQDDFVSTRFYAALGRLIDAHPTAGAAFCRCNLIDPQGAKIYEQPALQLEAGPVNNPSETLAIENRVQCAAIVVRRSAYEKVGGFDSQLAFALDWEMWIRIAASFPILYHPELLASFRIQAGSETSRLAKTGETVRDCMRMIERFPNYIPADRVKAVQSQARRWVCDLALQKAGAFFANNHAAWAMAQLHAGLRYDRRLSSWKIAFGCWRRSVRKSKKLIIPPLPLLPATWFRTKN
jgi:glycosyltransferase involved in cell wall biosynthesis